MTSHQDDPSSSTSRTQAPRNARTSLEGGRSIGRAFPGPAWALVVIVGFALVLGWTKMALTQSGTTLTLTPAEDTTVKQGTPNSSQGDNVSLRVQQGGINRVLVRFDQQFLEEGIATYGIRSAKLRLYVISNANNWGSSGRAVNVHRMTQAWTEQGTTWNCANDLNPFNNQSDCTSSWSMGTSSQWPFVAAATYSLVQQNNQTGRVEWDVTADVAQILSNNVLNYGWLIRKDNEGQAGQVEYGSRESLYKPELRLTVQGSNQAPQVSAGPDQTPGECTRAYLSPSRCVHTPR